MTSQSLPVWNSYSSFNCPLEFAMVIYLAVDGEDQFAVFASQRLSAGCRIDDGEAFMGEDGGFSLIDAVQSGRGDGYVYSFSGLADEGRRRCYGC